VKRSSKVTPKRRTYVGPGPNAAALAGGSPSATAALEPRELGRWAKDIASYFRRYNYAIEEMGESRSSPPARLSIRPRTSSPLPPPTSMRTVRPLSPGEVITFKGTYEASKGQAAALTFYAFVSLWAIALVADTLAPSGLWYAMMALSPGAGYYYMSTGTREERVRVKLSEADAVGADAAGEGAGLEEAPAGAWVEIVVEGDAEEMDRFAAELGLLEKGKVKVVGLLQ